MNYKTALKKMREEISNGDTEIAHSRADYILCELLKTLGYDELVKLYDEVPKWYA